MLEAAEDVAGDLHMSLQGHGRALQVTVSSAENFSNRAAERQCRSRKQEVDDN